MHYNIEKLLDFARPGSKNLAAPGTFGRASNRTARRSTPGTEAAQAAVAAAKARGKQIENDRKQRELEVDAKKQQIGRYSLQQFQTKKNEEYRALAHEIDSCNANIVELEDAQLELMEQADASQREIKAAGQHASELQKMARRLFTCWESRIGLWASRLTRCGRQRRATSRECRRSRMQTSRRF